MCGVRGRRQGGEAFGEVAEQDAVRRQEEEEARGDFPGVVGQRQLLPVRGHEFIRALVEGDGEEEQGVDGVADDGGGCGGDPPARVLAQAVEDADVQKLAGDVGDKARERDARDEYVQCLQSGQADELSFDEKDGDQVGEDERGYHHAKDDFARKARAEDAHGQVGGEEDEGEGECAPGGVQVAYFEGDLHEDVACGNDEDVPEGEPDEGFLPLRGGKGEGRGIGRWMCSDVHVFGFPSFLLWEGCEPQGGRLYAGMPRCQCLTPR